MTYNGVICNLGITISPPPGSNDTSGLDGSFVGELFPADVDDAEYVVDDAEYVVDGFTDVTKGEKVPGVDDGAGVADKEI